MRDKIVELSPARELFAHRCARWTARIKNATRQNFRCRARFPGWPKVAGRRANFGTELINAGYMVQRRRNSSRAGESSTICPATSPPPGRPFRRRCQDYCVLARIAIPRRCCKSRNSSRICACMVTSRAGGWLVGDQQFWFARQRHRDHQPAAACRPTFERIILQAAIPARGCLPVSTGE